MVGRGRYTHPAAEKPSSSPFLFTASEPRVDAVIGSPPTITQSLPLARLPPPAPSAAVTESECGRDREPRPPSRSPCAVKWRGRARLLLSCSVVLR